MNRSLFFFLCIVFVVALSFTACGQDYKATPQAVIDEANNHLTTGNCESAIAVLKPVYESPNVNNDVRMAYSSAYGCKGGISMPSLLAALVDTTSSDIWAKLVKANYSTGSDGKYDALGTSAQILRNTAVPSGSVGAADRSADANVFMVFVQLNIIATTISPLGAAVSTTGKKTQAIAGATTAQQCAIEVAMATISDSLQSAGTGGAIDAIRTALSSACTAALGACPTNRDPSVCTAVEQAQGTALLTAINSQWGT
jgi:hypothetical protein